MINLKEVHTMSKCRVASVTPFISILYRYLFINNRQLQNRKCPDGYVDIIRSHC